jgi:hypothetical protein
MDDFRVGSISPYDAHHTEQRPADSNHKKASRPKNGVHEDEIYRGQSAESDSETEDDLGVQGTTLRRVEQSSLSSEG